MSNKPKVAGSFGAGGIVVLLIWVWGIISPDKPLDPEVAAALAALIGGMYGPVKRMIDRRFNA